MSTTLVGVEEQPQRGPGEGAGRSGETEHVQVHAIGKRRFVVADVEPLDVDGVRTVAVGTVLWAVAFVLLLPFYGRLVDSGRDWWLWTCVAGFGLGLIGVDYCRRRRRGQVVIREGEQGATARSGRARRPS